jgi:hypothetical protein
VIVGDFLPPLRQQCNAFERLLQAVGRVGQLGRRIRTARQASLQHLQIIISMSPERLERPTMFSAPAVIVHGIDQARAALRPGLPVILLSAPAAAGYAGCGWWRALVDLAAGEHPATPHIDVLDCGIAPGLAMAALRIGQRHLILAPSSPAFAAVAAAGAGLGALVFGEPPAALDLAERSASRRLVPWLRGDIAPGLL